MIAVRRLFHKEDWCPPLGGFPLVEITTTYGKTVKDELLKAKAWGESGVLFLEHDIFVDGETLSEMEDYIIRREISNQKVRRELIAFPYHLYTVTTGLPWPVIAHRKFSPELKNYSWLVDTDFKCDVELGWHAWVKSCGMGCTYIPVGAEPEIRDSWDYPTFDTEMSIYLNRERGFEILVPHIFARHTHAKEVFLK